MVLRIGEILTDLDEELVFAFGAIGAVTLHDYLDEFVEALVDYKNIVIIQG